MSTTQRTLAVFALTAALALTGCVDSINGDDGFLGSSSTDSDENLAIHLTAENVPEDAGHLGLVFKDIFVHNAANASSEGYYELTVKTGHADLVGGNGTASAQVASGENIPAGTYDQIRFQLRDVDAAIAAEGNASAHDHDHGEGEANDDHDHGEASGDAKVQAPMDIPVNLIFEVTEDDLTEVDIVIDVGASLEGDSFQPVITRAEVTVDGETETIDDVEVLTQEEAGEISADAPDTAPPVARTSVFGPNGNQDYETDFEAEGGDFVNDFNTSYVLGESLRFSGSDSEAVETGATIESYAWDFGDGESTQGATVTHTYADPGVFEVTLTVTDSNGVSDDHSVRVVVAGWTTMAHDTSFEEEGDWTVSTSQTSLTSWGKTSGGYESDTAWYAGHHVGVEDPGYTPLASTTLTSPEIEVPSDWLQAGFTFYVQGSSEAGFDGLTASYTIDGEDETELGFFSGSQEDWKRVHEINGLADVRGETIQFHFTFSSDLAVQEGEGWYVDAVSIGGLPSDSFQNVELLDEIAHDGHDHEH